MMVNFYSNKTPYYLRKFITVNDGCMPSLEAAEDQHPFPPDFWNWLGMMEECIPVARPTPALEKLPTLPFSWDNATFQELWCNV